MNKTFIETIIKLVIPEKADPEIVIRTLGKYYKIDRVSEPIEKEPLLLFIKEIERKKKKEPVELVGVGFEKIESKTDRIINKLV